MASLTWNPGLKSLGGAITAWGDRGRGASIAFGQQTGDEAEREMKRKAPWQDQTGEARRRLFAIAEERGGVISVVMAHGVPYGYYLERRWDGKFGIVVKTARRYAVELVRFLRKGGAR